MCLQLITEELYKKTYYIIASYKKKKPFLKLLFFTGENL